MGYPLPPPFPTRATPPPTPPQGINILMFLIRLVSHVSFQPRLGVLSNTLFAQFNDLSHFLFVFLFVNVMIGAVSSMCRGSQSPILQRMGCGISTSPFAYSLAWLPAGLGPQPDLGPYPYPHLHHCNRSTPPCLATCGTTSPASTSRSCPCCTPTSAPCATRWSSWASST